MSKAYTPRLLDVGQAIKIYYSCPELQNSDIRELFGNIASSTIAKLKNVVKDEQKARERPSFTLRGINTEIAFEVWGLNIADLERRYSKLKKYQQ